MAQITLPLFMILICYVTFVTTERFNEFSRNSSLDNNVCFETEVVFVSTYVDSSQCLWKCTLDHSCMSAFYQPESGYCTGCNAAYFRTGDVSGSIGTMYYALKTKKYGQTCYGGDTCIGTNGACFDGTCLCVMGYSYDFKTKTCVDHCVQYGSTFQEYPGYRLLSLDGDILKPVTMETCKQTCVTTNTCLCFEYKTSNSKCQLNNATPLSDPSNVDAYDEMTLYLRNCDE